MAPQRRRVQLPRCHFSIRVGRSAGPPQAPKRLRLPLRFLKYHFRILNSVACSHLIPALEVLHFALVLLGVFAAVEGAEIATPARLGVGLSRIEPILSRL